MLNPKFVYVSPLRDHADLAEHVDHAIIALDGRAPIGGQRTIETLAPISASENAVRVELWVNDLDDYTCTYGFLCSSEDGRVPHARGERSVVSLGWTPEFRASHVELLKDLPAYA